MIYIVRHGQTAQNHANLLQGRGDFPLNEKGTKQAMAVGAWFRNHGIHFDAVYSSPLQRAMKTAALIAGDAVNIQMDERLIEMDYGPYEGLDLTKPAPELLAFFRDFVHTPAPAGMEPLEAVTERLGAFLEAHRAEAGSKILLISTHAIAMKGALEYLTPQSQGSYWSKYIGNCAVYQVPVTGGAFGIPYELSMEPAAPGEG